MRRISFVFVMFACLLVKIYAENPFQIEHEIIEGKNSTVAVAITITNVSPKIVLFSHLSIADEKGTTHSQVCTIPIIGKNGSAKFRFIAEYWMEFLLMEARMPMPPKFKYRGRDRLITIKALAPKRKATIFAHFTKEEGKEKKVALNISYCFPPTSSQLYLADHYRAQVHQLPELPHRWLKVATLFLDYIPVESISKQSSEPRQFENKNMNVPHLEVFMYAILQQEYNVLSFTKETMYIYVP